MESTPKRDTSQSDPITQRRFVITGMVVYAIVTACAILLALIVAYCLRFDEISAALTRPQRAKKLVGAIFASIPAAVIIGGILSYLHFQSSTRVKRILAVVWGLYSIPITLQILFLTGGISTRGLLILLVL